MTAIDIKKELSRPAKAPNAFKKIFIGGLLSCIPFLFFASAGYIWEILTSSLEDEESQPELPEWSNFLQYMAEGIVPFLIMLAYLGVGLIPFAAAGISGFFLYSVSEASKKGLLHNGWLSLMTGTIGGIIAFCIFLAIYGLIPIALSYYAQTGDLRETFRPSEIIFRLQAARSDWIKVIGISYIPVLSWLALDLLPITLIWKQIPAVFIGFYIWLVVAHLAGKITRSNFSIEDEVVASEESDLRYGITANGVNINSKELDDLKDYLK